MLSRSCRFPTIVGRLGQSPVARRRLLHASICQSDKILAVLYPDPVTGYPPERYARLHTLPHITHYPNGQTTPTPTSIDFVPGQLLGCVSGELGLRSFLEAAGHELIVTADKDGSNCEFDLHLPEATYVISQPFYPAYLTADRLGRAKHLKAAITAGSKFARRHF